MIDLGVSDLYFRAPRHSECNALSELVFHSKASHGYSDEFMEACRDEIRVTAETLLKGPAQIVSKDAHSDVLGFVQIVETGARTCEIEALFIAPHVQRMGIGQALFQWAVDAAQAQGFKTITINSDPGAEAFYLSQGAVLIGKTPSGSIAGRCLPRLRFDL